MADQAITALPKKTYSGSSQIASTDYLLGIDSAEGYQMLIQDLGEYIINRVTASLAGSTQTLASAISALNSKSIHITGNLSTFSIPVPSKQPNAYHTVMIYGITGSNANDAFMYLVFINVDAQNKVIVIPIKAHGSITITGAWDASTKVLTLTSSAVIYGGLWALT